MLDVVTDAGSDGVPVGEMPALMGASIATATTRIAHAEHAGHVVRTADDRLVSTALLERLAQRRDRGPMTRATAALLTQRLEASKPPTTRPLSPRAATMLAELEKRGLSPPAPAEWLSRLDTDPRGLTATAKELIDAGLAVRAGELWFAKGRLDALEEKVRAHFATHRTLDTQTFKQLCGDLSRKFVIPLAEHLDAKRVTLRVGEHRVLRVSHA